MNTQPWFLRSDALWTACMVVGLSMIGPMVQGQESGSGKPALPTDPALWINSPPLTWELLAGKGAVFYFYEEDCPSCRGKWPDHLKEAAKFQGKPVLFVGVNSGNDRNTVASYVREQGINWPVIVDMDRSFEKAAGVPPLSLQNIWQYMTLSADGKFRPSRGFSMDKAGEDAASGAKWNIDPVDIPPALRGAWMGVEFGAYSSSAVEIQKNLRSPKPELKAGAEKLNEYVQAEIAKRAKSAGDALAAGGKWPAYQQYVSLQQEFKGYTLPPEVDPTVKTLLADDAVKTETMAMKRFDAAAKLISAPTPAAQKRGRTMLEALLKDSLSTEAGQKAQALLQQIQP